MKKLKVLIADDSALMRSLLTEILAQDPELEVVGAVSDAFQAREAIKKLNPDVLTLDVEMPKMDGISFLEKLMRLRPMPVVMISAATQKGADSTMKALMLGAVDFIGKPKVDVANTLNEYADTIRSKVKAAGRTIDGKSDAPSNEPSTAIKATPLHLAKQDEAGPNKTVIAIGASTGGVEAIHKLLSALPTNLPPIMITQHMPPVFSTSFARRLNQQLDLEVHEALDGQQIKPGNVYIAPGDQHLSLAKRGSTMVCKLRKGPAVNRHIPSVDVLFESIAAMAAANSIGLLLTGMGSDGASGLLAMRNAGATTIAQDKASSVVWGMPREAIEIGAAQHVLALQKMNGKLVSLCDRHGIENTAKELLNGH